MELSQVTLICKALADPNRLRIVQVLTCGEQCGCELLDQMQITQPTLSHHMKVLGGCGLVSSVKKGKWNHYSLNCDQWFPKNAASRRNKRSGLAPALAAACAGEMYAEHAPAR